MDRPDKVTAFDSLFTTNHIQMLKILLSFLKPPLQGKVAVYIRFLEFQYTLRFFTENPYAAVFSDAGIPLSPFSGAADSGGFAALFDEMLPYCDMREREQLRNLQNTLKNMENMQQMMQMVQMLQEAFPEGFSPAGFTGSSSDAAAPDGSDRAGASNGTRGGVFQGGSADSNTGSGFPGGFSGMQMDEMMQMAEMMKELFQN